MAFVEAHVTSNGIKAFLVLIPQLLHFLILAY